eukprot:112011-Chlamydomonas_euryale.AAC.2
MPAAFCLLTAVVHLSVFQLRFWHELPRTIASHARMPRSFNSLMAPRQDASNVTALGLGTGLPQPPRGCAWEGQG